MAQIFKAVATHFWQKATSTNDYWLTRFVLLRVLGFVYLFAFLSLATQVIPLIGENGLLPADNYLDAVEDAYPSKITAFKALPTLFWLHISDEALQLLAWLGVLLSVVVLTGFANSILMLALWFLYMSFVHVGQLWYSYGWEIQLLETGFLAAFLVPFCEMRPFPKTAPPVPIIWLFRWLAFRINLGAGLIKLRHDACWRDLSCLFYHYQTQPIPNPLSPWLHFMPQWFHKAGVLVTHLVQLIAPFFILLPLGRIRILGGALLLGFQLVLITTGNYSFLNWITIVPIIAAFDDKFLKKFLPRWIARRAGNASKAAKPNPLQQAFAFAAVFLVIGLSVPVVQNLFSPSQAMNNAYSPWSLVNTYGAFGSITKVRHELVFQGTTDEIITPQTQWKEYEFKAKPTSVNRQLPIIAPYQPRIDWQLWFAAFQKPDQNPWIINLVWKLLHNDNDVMKLIKYNPFPGEPPKHVRIEFYRYEFEKPGNKAVWKRTYVGTYIPPLSLQTPQLKEFITQNGWNTYE